MLLATPIQFQEEPNKIANGNAMGALQGILTRSIAKYEKQCLNEVFGSLLAKELRDSFEIVSGATSFTLNPSATNPIKDLVNGKTYDVVVNGVTVQRVWNGIVVSNEVLEGGELTSEKTSFITDYIYYHWLLDNRTISTGTGQQTLQGENSLPNQNFSKRIDAWNRFIDKVVFYVSNCNNENVKGEVSLYKFLNDNIADYPNWIKNNNLEIKDKY